MPLHVALTLLLIPLAIGVKVWLNQKAKTDPAMVDRLGQVRDRMSGGTLGYRFAANRIAWVLGVLGLLILNQEVTRLAKVGHWTDNFEMAVMAAGIVALIVVSYFLDKLLARVFRGYIPKSR